MTTDKLYQSMAERTNGDIYIGVVGPVRSGKSTFIRRFMENLVIPNIKEGYLKDRTIDELPQASQGKMIMTTEPKFIPEEAVQVTLGDVASVSLRMIDCVGYVIPSAVGYIENDSPRMVRTPWFESEIPFNMAAEIGTEKVISEHSTVGIVITSDGSITELPRDEYEECEERVIGELSGLGKPFVVLMNTQNEQSVEAVSLCSEMSEKYGVPVMPINVLTMTKEDIESILTELLYAFPVKEINVVMPKWVSSLKKGHWLKAELYDSIRKAAPELRYIRDVKHLSQAVGCCEDVLTSEITKVDLGNGTARLGVTLDNRLFYRILSEETGLELSSEDELMPKILELVEFKRRLEKFSEALNEVEQTGYGIVMPTESELTAFEPEIIRQGGKYGVRFTASAPSIHLIKADIAAEVAPIVGTEKQSEELISYLMSDYETDPLKIWETNIFGKSVSELVEEGLEQKLSRLPDDAREKLREAVERIVNEGCSGLICLLV